VCVCGGEGEMKTASTFQLDCLVREVSRQS
jgi:hypothetical protein